MCTTCGCGVGQTRINGQSMPSRHRSNTRLHYRPSQSAHDPAHEQVSAPVTADHATDTLHFGTGIAGTHAPGMSQSRIVKIERDILAKNNQYAAENRRYFAQHGIFALNLVSSPGSGKTTVLVKTIEMLRDRFPIAVIEGDQQTDHDAARIRATGVPALQINTGKGCHLDAHMIGQALQQMSILDNSLLFIENVGNLVCPSGFDLGEAHKVVILSATEGEDKPLKYPDMFHAADLMLLNKCDLLPHLTFDVDLAIDYAHRIHPGLPVLQISATLGSGMQAWIDWISAGCHRAAAASQLPQHIDSTLG
ncbi:hydrogenase nickel incorporation protein HypB [Nitrosomonas oligotropha]|uniref:hydrogenase nickel incorporation protein HypB n=1 Tax=Nitrosomonas oligotropha TaxID=42354 RepID=UPI00136B004D|nr:hydrogenase nickel incorporation protein HypB [Nitrosomonas oligotropha]MXS82351.1 hydrogenase nickel incorporation protein HypB [Nitrosomonas oligotropha]